MQDRQTVTDEGKNCYATAAFQQVTQQARLQKSSALVSLLTIVCCPFRYIQGYVA